VSNSILQWTEGCSEKYLKVLVGTREMEDALERLDKLTNELTATAQSLEAHAYCR
jgi:hypothetical protein